LYWIRCLAWFQHGTDWTKIGTKIPPPAKALVFSKTHNPAGSFAGK